MKAVLNYHKFFMFIMLLFASFILLNADISFGACFTTINKEAVSADDTVFQFTTDAPGVNDFALLSGESTDFLFDGSGSFMVQEEVPPLWRLDGVDCGTPEGDITVEMLEDGILINCPSGMNSIECTFVNSLLPEPVASDIPTLSQWGLLAMAGILGIVGFMVLRRKKVSA